MEELLGSILLLPYNFAPQGTFFCDGRLLPIAQYTALFSLLGTTFGGDGRSTFALPKMTAPAAGLHYVICWQGIFPSRP